MEDDHHRRLQGSLLEHAGLPSMLGQGLHNSGLLEPASLKGSGLVLHGGMPDAKPVSTPGLGGAATQKVKISLRKAVAQQLRRLFDLQHDETLPAEHVNEALLFLFDEMKSNPDLKARFWQHMSDAKRKREEIHIGPAAKRQRRYRERLKEKARKEKAMLHSGQGPPQPQQPPPQPPQPSPQHQHQPPPPPGPPQQLQHEHQQLQHQHQPLQPASDQGPMGKSTI
eukprot:CAMPEP_0202076384 /NCGR_PEP_ID=MMETSP0964-20121228/4777_1 /ASSEMBLY_ACC=CAM_ASM_000500 /TAXON_ID=4773 /ORGANISM="Schizochytrium aggregatum, Strain ATCC28209" /LENGTH=224 /DNA_ID=CAMNT_0048643629 /DNA_START=48 /DNA_END=722 /DNA_ORIENTATION=+